MKSLRERVRALEEENERLRREAKKALIEKEEAKVINTFLREKQLELVRVRQEAACALGSLEMPNVEDARRALCRALVPEEIEE